MMRKLFLLSIFLFLCAQAHAMITPTFGWDASAPSTTVVNYSALSRGSTGASYSATESDVQTVVPITTTAQKLYVTLSGSPGASTSYTYALMVNGNASTLTCQIADAATTCSDITNTVSLSAGDLVSLRITPAGTTPTSRNQHFNLETSAAANVSMVMGSALAPSVSAANYASISVQNSWNATQLDRSTVMSSGGSLTDLYVKLTADPDNGGGTQSYAFVLMLNASAQTLTCTVSDGATICNDTTHPITIAAGDLVSIRSTPANTPVAVNVGWGFKFAPTTDGESVLMYTAQSSKPSNSVVNYLSWSAVVSATGTEANLDTNASTMTLKNLYVNIGTAPDTGVGTQDWTIFNRATAGNGTLTCVISEAATTCNDTTHSDAYTASNFTMVGTAVTPSGTPTVPGRFRVGYTAFVSPSNVKTFQGVARASIKKIDGVAIASVKKVDGVA